MLVNPEYPVYNTPVDLVGSVMSDNKLPVKLPLICTVALVSEQGL